MYPCGRKKRQALLQFFLLQMCLPLCVCLLQSSHTLFHIIRWLSQICQAELQLYGCSLQLYGCSLQLCGCLSQLYGRSLQLCGCLSQLYGQSLQFYGCSLQLCRRLLHKKGSLLYKTTYCL